MKTFAQADRLVHQALLRLRTPEMQPLLAFFNSMLEETKTALIRADEDTFRRLQGRAGMLEEITEAAKKADSVLEKLQK